MKRILVVDDAVFMRMAIKIAGSFLLKSEYVKTLGSDVLGKEIDLLINRLLKAIEINDEETITKINREVDVILVKLLPNDNRQT